jgi:hypothetical protein
VLGFTSLIATLLAPFVICPVSTGALHDVIRLGWHSKYVSDLQRLGLLIVAACLLVHGIVQPLDWLHRRRRVTSPPLQGEAAGLLAWLQFRFSGRRRWLSIAVLIIAVGGFVAIQFGTPLYRRWSWTRRMTRWSPAQFAAMVQCMNYLEAPTQVIYSDDPKVMAGLSYATHSEYLIAQTSISLRQGPKCWNAMLPLPGSSSTFAYLHRVKTSDGNERLVAVGFEAISSNLAYGDGKDDRLARLYGCVYVPGTASKAPVNLTLPAAGIMGFPNVAVCQEFRLQKNDLMTIYAGQPNPTDPSAFTIDYVLNGVRDTIDGRIEGTSVKLMRRQR